jgi:hypothetical protein
MLLLKKYNNMQNLCIFFLILSFTHLSIYCTKANANTGDSDLEIRYAAELNHLPIGCRIIAMGNTGVVLPYSDINFFWNPSLLSYSQKREISVEGAKLYGGLSSIGTISFNAPIQKGPNVGILYKAFFPDEIIEYDSLPGTLFERQGNYDLNGYVSKGTFHNNHHSIIVSLAKKFTINNLRPTSFSLPLPITLGAGINIKSVWQTMTPGEKVRMGYNINLDGGFIIGLGVDYNISEKEIMREILVAFAIKDFSPTKMIWLHSYEGYEEPVHHTEYYGLSYIDRSGFLHGNWTISLAMHKLYEVSLHAGLEGEFFNMVSFRCGISNKIFTVGTGIHYKNYSVDYSFSFDEIAFSFFRLAVGYKF